MLRSSATVVALELMRARSRAAMSLAAGLLAVITVFVVFFVGVRPVQAAPTTFIVNSSGDAGDVTLDGTCDSDDSTTGNQCTFRAAIQEANNTTDADTIDFNIPGTEVKRIQLGTLLPPLTQSVSINGYSQPGASANTIAEARNGTNAQIKIEVDGRGAGNGVGFHIMADDVSIKGLAIYGFGDSSAIFSSSEPDRLSIQGNFIGTNSGGTADIGNGGGVQISSKSISPVGTADVTVGGDTPAARNLISGNNSDGVSITDVRNSEVQGNIIGTQKDGTTPLPNDGTGVGLEAVSNLSSLSNNYVGADGADDDDAAEANLIANNTSDGVRICSTNNDGLRALISRNSIFSNFNGIGLCLINPPPDPGDPDTGSNDGQNYPVITSAKTSRKATTIKGTLDSEPGQTYNLEFFSNPVISKSAGIPYQGKTFEAVRTVHTDGIPGPDSFTFKLKGTEKIRAGQFVTATASREDRGVTSEFSEARKVKRQ